MPVIPALWEAKPGTGIDDCNGQLGRCFHDGIAVLGSNIAGNLSTPEWVARQQHLRLLDGSFQKLLGSMYSAAPIICAGHQNQGIFY
ncbi:hypothetical protein AAY473_001189 [Plecturocebus cupreus]